MPCDGLAMCIESAPIPSATAVEPTSTPKYGPVRVLPDASDKSLAGQKLVGLLTRVERDASDKETLRQRRAALAVLNQLLRMDQEKSSTSIDASVQLEGREQIEAIERAFDVAQYPKEVTACEFAGLQHEDLNVKETKSISTKYPIPTNEDDRMAAIQHFSLPTVLDVPELNVICALAAAEMQCPHGIVTLVERDVVSLLATNDHGYWEVGSGNPREHAFCQQFIMHEKPLLVHHAATDPRFAHIAPVTKLNLQFYAGFPLTVSSVSTPSGQANDIIVGALCCLDTKPRDMTRSQYWRLVKLAKAASSILEKAAKEQSVENCPPSQGAEVENR